MADFQNSVQAKIHDFSYKLMKNIPLSDKTVKESICQDKVSLSGYKASIPSPTNMRIQYDIDEFMKNANQYLNNS